MMQHDDALLELVALYAAGALPASECRAVQAHIARCAQCRRQFAEDSAAASMLALGAAQAPPPGLRAKTLRAALQSARTPIGRYFPAWLQGVAAAAAVAGLIISGVYFWQQRPVRERSWIAVCAPAQLNCGVTGRVVSAAADNMMFEAHGLRQLPADKVYQAWIIREGSRPRPAPTFRCDAQGNAIVRIRAAPVKGMTLAITIEPRGGSAAPTSKPFLAAAID
jgi:anti-sigma-K factor RskA